MNPTHCVRPRDSRELCFQEVDQAVLSALERSLWTGFPRVLLLGARDVPGPLDYVLKLELALDTLPPSGEGPGWAARAKGSWQLWQSGRRVAAESLESHSRAEFAYGRPLGAGAGEVVDAIALHISMTVGSVPETHPDQPTPLPAVTAQRMSGEPPLAKATH